MISNRDFDWIKSELETGKVCAIVANKTIQALENQQRHISELQDQLKNCQSKCQYLRSIA